MIKVAMIPFRFIVLVALSSILVVVWLAIGLYNAVKKKPFPSLAGKTDWTWALNWVCTGENVSNKTRA